MRRPRVDPEMEFLLSLVAESAAVPDRSAAPAGPCAARRVVAAALAAWLRQRDIAPRGRLFDDAPAAGTAADEVVRAALAGRDPRPWSPAFLARVYPELLERRTRKRGGVWFTAADLVRPTVARALQPLLAATADPLSLRIVDPAAGGGAFLAAALHHIVAATGADPGAVASHCLHGLDQDPTAADLAAWVVWQAAGSAAPPIATIEAGIRPGDGLLQPTPGCHDAVLGNPPWETLLVRDDCERAALLRAAFPHHRGRLYTYRLFTEQALRLLRPGGRLGLILPASLYFDRDAGPLRRLLLDECEWEWLHAFENRRGLFAIDSRYRFAAVIARKGGSTSAIRASFGREDPADWGRPQPTHVRYPRSLVRRLSPHSGALVEVRCDRDLDLLSRIYRHGIPLLDLAGGPLHFTQGDFNLTSDAGQFLPRTTQERRGFRQQPDGSYRRQGDDRCQWPLLQGAMLWDFGVGAAAHVSGTGHGTRWRPIGPGRLRPQFLVPDHAWQERRRRRGRTLAPARLLFRTLSNATNQRTAVCGLAPGSLPAGNSVGVLTAPETNADSVELTAFGCAVMGSLVYDWVLRQRLAGTNLNAFVLADTVWPTVDGATRRRLAQLALRIGAVHTWDESLRAHLDDAAAAPAPDARLLRVELDVAVARAFGLSVADLAWILRDCGLPAAELREASRQRRLDPKGFWRVDRDQPPEHRHTVQVLAAMRSRSGSHPGPTADGLPHPAARDSRSRR